LWLSAVFGKKVPQIPWMDLVGGGGGGNGKRGKRKFAEGMTTQF